MAGTFARSPVLYTAAVGLDYGELAGPSRKARRIRVMSAGVPGLKLRPSSDLSCSASGCRLQTLTGMRRANVVDAAAVKPGGCLVVVWRAAPGVAVTAEIGEKSTELVIDPAQEEAGSANGLENLSIPNFETGSSFVGQKDSPLGERVRSTGLNGAIDSHQPEVDRSMEGSTTGSFRSGPIPSSVASKSKGKGVMVDRWVPPGSKLYQVKQLLERLESAESTDEAMKVAMDGWDSPITPRDMTSVISNLKWKKARAFFNWLQSQGYELNVVVYNVLLGTFRAGKVWNVADEFGRQMIADGVELDNYSYSTLISCALKCNSPLDALRWFDKMHEAGCVPDEVTYSTMALVYSRLGRFEEAVGLYERLKETGWKPDKISFGTMVNVYSRGGNYYKASAVIREMQEAGIEPEAVVYNTLIRYFAREGKTGQAKRVFQDMERLGVKPSEYTLSLMIDVHGRAGETKEAFQLFTRMKEEKLPLDVVVYNSLLKMCAEERLVGEGENLLAGMVGRGLKPDIVTYKSVVNLYAKEGKTKEAEKFANRMVEVGLTLDVVVYSCLMKACGISKDFKRAATFFERMLADGCHVDDKCCGVLLSLLNMCETVEDRSVVIGCLEKSKPVLGAIVNLLLAEEAHVNEVQEQVRNLLSDSERESHRPFCNALVDLCWSLGKKHRAQDLLSLADSLKVYPGGLRTKTNQLWLLHLRSLSFNAAECGLFAWIEYLREQTEQGEGLPETLAIETGSGRNRQEVTRLFNVILAKLKDIGAPFEPTFERSDWIVSSGSATKSWLAASKV